MIEDSHAAVVLTQYPLRETLSASTALVLYLDCDWSTIMQESQETLVSGALPEHLAYVIYTSGSTGTPKGVMICHQHVTRLFASTEAWIKPGSQDVWTLFHSYAFDFSVWELWGALLYGGRLIVVPYWISRSAESFATLLCSHRVSVLNQTPSAFWQLIAGSQLERHANDLSLRLVIFGGEALELSGLASWFARYGDQSPRLINMYGITETTVHVTYRPLTNADLHAEVLSPIGWAIPDLQVYVLDKYQQPAPIGVAGELYVGGAGVSRGYLGRPELTAERFVPHPFSATPGTRLYRTGDLVRWLSKGELEYLGRIDQQVKIRGFRIELGEIEAALTHHPVVRTAVVILQVLADGQRRLIAYVVAENPTTSLPVDALRQYLHERLPGYMVPAVFVQLDTFPLTPGGKVDRQALPQPETTRPVLDIAYVAPRTEIEEVLAGIWSQVLKLDQVGVYDNFFALGGDSLLATQLIGKVRKALQIELPLRSLFEYPNIAELTLVIARSSKTDIKSRTGPISRSKRSDTQYLIAKLDQLSEKEIETLLTQMLLDENHQNRGE